MLRSRMFSIHDLETETVGFQEHQVEAYVDKVSDESAKSQFMDFINQNWAMKGLMRVPIQLDSSNQAGNQNTGPQILPSDIEIKNTTFFISHSRNISLLITSSRAGKLAKKIETLDLQSGTVIFISPEDFIGHEKYSRRYNIMYRFVTGILESEENDLIRFLQQIEMKPRDLLGFAHARLLMYCFNEFSEPTQSLTVGKLREDIDNQLSQLLVSFREEIGKEPEFPERVLSKCLEKDQIWRLYQSTPDEDIRNNAALIIGQFPIFSSEKVIQVIFDSNRNLYNQVFRGLEERPDLPEAILFALVVAIRLLWGWEAARLLEQQVELPQPITDYFFSNLSANSHKGRKTAVRAQAKCSRSKQNIRRRFFKLLDDPDESVRQESLMALKDVSDLSKSDCYDLFQRIHNISPRGVFRVFESQQALPPMILSQMWRMLENDSEFIQHRAFGFLKRYNAFSEDETVKWFRSSEYQDNFAIDVTNGSFRHDAFPPQILLDHYVSIVTRSWKVMNLGGGSDEFDGRGIESRAISALRDCSHLPSDIIHTLWQMNETYGGVRTIEWVLETQKTLPQDVLNGIASHIEQSNGPERKKWIWMLKKQSLRLSRRSLRRLHV
ncbi:uncharacterized protein KD926_009570 [Aspergillus affinis]|uniref:uncharacterized protein n=1 Tax=Aspergillus affinis TaxID=1070780 RepID=UPI0022FEC6AA|nr:uncharacterized protein KD926_009570 [Aspergillus affinis]KAI9045156.1 hypothetical protein KD926_009570 [Aspergillus affinis]